MILGKEIWLESAMEIIKERISTAEKALKRAQEASQGEEKSSAGDKYETARAMNQLESNMNARQMQQALNELAILEKIDLSKKEVVCSGALIRTKENYYFVAVGLGKIEFKGESCIVISPSSPIGKEFIGKHIGDRIAWNKEEIEILDIV